MPAEHHDPDRSSESSAARHQRRYVDALLAIYAVEDGRGSIVDAACGSGYGADLAKKTFPFAEVIGIDRDRLAIQRAEAAYPDCRFYCLDISDARSWLRVFRPIQAVVSIETLEHLDGPGAQRKWIAAVSSMLEDGGLFWLACPVREEPGPSIANPYHLWEPSESGVVAMLEWAGLRVIMQETEEYHSTAGEVSCQLAILAQKG